jgi:5-formyltetrahydrofolate cyclo-ligase
VSMPDEVKAWRRVERARLIAARVATSAGQRRATRERVRAMLADVPELRGSTVGFYWPFRGEIDLVGFVRELTTADGRAALPVLVAKGQPLAFWRWEHGMEMRPGIWDIPVPVVAEPVEPECLLVPLVGFDDQGYRLGYGGGFYDRTIAAL